MALTIDQAINALAAQQGVPPSAVNINDAISYANQSFQQSFFSTPAPAPVYEPAPALFMPTSAPAPSPTPTPVLSAPASMPVFGPAAPTATPAPTPTPAPAPAATGMMMPTVSPTQTDAIVREVSTRFPEDGGRVQEIARLYQETLGRSPDIDGLISYTTSGKSLETIKRDMAYSPEGQTLIKTLFNNTLGRDPDSGAIKTYTEFLAKEKPYIQSYGNSEIEALKTELKISPEGQARNADPAAAELARIYKEYAGRDLDASGYAYFKDALTSPDGAAKIAEAIKTGDEAELRTKLGRQPTEAEAQEYMQAKDAQRAAEGRQFGNFVKSVIPFALNLAFPGIGASIGASLGLSGAAAQAVGNAIVSGVTSGVTTGDTEKALLTAALAGGGTYAVSSGAVGNVMNNIGLGDVAQQLNIPIGNVISEADFIAADASQLARQGLGTAAIQQNLVAAGVDPTIAASAANLAVTGASAAAISADIGKFASPTTPLLTAPTGMPSGTVGPTPGMMTGPGAAAAGATGAGATGAGGAGATGAGAGAAGGVTNLGNLAGAAGTGLLSNLANTALGNIGNLNLGGVVGAGIDFAQLQALQREATGLGRTLAGEAAAIGREAAVPFTPYTVTTGAGVGTVAPGAATATTAPAYEQLRQQQLGLAGQAFGAVNPQQAAQTLYGQVEALAAPGRAREQEALLAGLQQRGLLGLGVNQPVVGGGVRTVSPLMESLLSAQETARAQQALQATQFGTQEAIRQAGLGQGLVAGAQGIDQQTLAALNAAATLGQQERALASRNELLQAEAALQGLRMRAPYEQLGLQARGTALAGVGGAARGLFGLPTQQGNVLGNLTLGQLFSGAGPAAPAGQGTGPQYQYQDYGIFF